MARSGRFSTIAPLPPHGAWRRTLALARGAGAPRPVVLAYVPATVLDAPDRLAALVRDVEAAARLGHPAVVPVLGTETVGDALAVVEDWVPGTTLRALLDAGGRLPPDVAARIAADVGGALAGAHAFDEGDGRPLAHGAVSAAHVVVGDDGVARLCGFGEEPGGRPEDDVRGLAAVLHECLAGEPPAPGAAALDVPGVPPPLAAAVERALAAAPEGPPPAAAFVEAISAAAPLASHADAAAYVDAIAPAEDGPDALRRGLERAGDEAEEVSEDLILEPTDPAVVRPAVAGDRVVEPTEPVAVRAAPSEDRSVEPTDPVVVPPAVSAELPRPPQTRPGSDPAGTFQAPAAAPARYSVPVVVAAAVLCAMAGFGVGFAILRGRVAEPSPAPAPAATAPQMPSPVAGTAAPSEEKPPAPARAKSPRPAKAPARVARREPAPAGKGTLKVSAPDDADVFLDGKRIGRGSLKVEIATGPHRLEVRRGDAKVGERFSVEPNETWTYDVTPTPPAE